MVGRGHPIHPDIRAREVVDRQMPRLEQQVGVRTVGDDLAVELDAHPPRRGLEQDLVVGVGPERGFARLGGCRHDRLLSQVCL
jgi:hypothetical protein